MTVALGVMEVPAPVEGDSIRRYETGTLPDGGMWTALRRLSDHDHTGGQNGAPISVTSLPDGSITIDKLDPAIFAPYTLVDGSKPFTGQVTMEQDAILRDTLYFGQQGTALAPDATLSRTGPGALRADSHLGVGVNPAAWGSTFRAIQMGQAGVVRGNTGAAGLGLIDNSYQDGTNDRALVAGAASLLALGSGTISAYTAPSVAAGATQTFTARLALAPTGTLTLTPDAPQPALAGNFSGGAWSILPGTSDGRNLRFGSAFAFEFGPGNSAGTKAYIGANGTLTLTPDAGQDALNVTGKIANQTGNLVLRGSSAYVTPDADGGINMGHPSIRWAVYYAVNGIVQTSSREYKEGVTPLDPGLAMEAVRNTPAVTFDYVAPTRGPEWYDLPDDPEQAEAVLQQRLTAAPLEAAARHQHGFVAEDCHELFLVGEGQTSPGSSVGVLLAALQNIDQRLAALETP